MNRLEKIKNLPCLPEGYGFSMQSIDVDPNEYPDSLYDEQDIHCPRCGEDIEIVTFWMDNVEWGVCETCDFEWELNG